MGRGPARVYALTRQDAQASNAVVTSILSVCSFDAHVLFDSGSTLSYVSPVFVKCFSKELVRLEKPFLVTTPVGETLLMQYSYRVCCVIVCGRDTIVDLMLLEMSDVDVIIGMDWLASCHAMVNCHEKVVKFNALVGKAFIFQGDRSDVPNNISSMLSAQWLLRKGSQGYLAFVRDMEKDVECVDMVFVVREFLDVFQEEFFGLPSDREIEFAMCYQGRNPFLYRHIGWLLRNSRSLMSNFKIY